MRMIKYVVLLSMLALSNQAQAQTINEFMTLEGATMIRNPIACYEPESTTKEIIHMCFYYMLGKVGFLAAIKIEDSLTLKQNSVVDRSFVRSQGETVEIPPAELLKGLQLMISQ